MPRRTVTRDEPVELARGIRARIQLGPYAIAADVEGYVIARDVQRRTIVRAHVRNADDYKLAQTPLTFIVTLQRGEWEWPVRDILGYRDHAFTAVLGEAVAVIRRTA